MPSKTDLILRSVRRTRLEGRTRRMPRQTETPPSADQRSRRQRAPTVPGERILRSIVACLLPLNGGRLYRLRLPSILRSWSGSDNGLRKVGNEQDAVSAERQCPPVERHAGDRGGALLAERQIGRAHV